LCIHVFLSTYDCLYFCLFEIPYLHKIIIYHFVVTAVIFLAPQSRFVLFPLPIFFFFLFLLVLLFI
jgi:hypothetical protein